MALLWECGTDGMEVVAAPEGHVAFVAYFPATTGLETELRGQLQRLPRARLEAVAVPEVDWVARFRAGFKAFAAGSFWIAPAWEAGGAPDGRRLLVVDPGRAFGTGTHETTRLCLRAVEALSPPPAPSARVIDVGTGTGILAIAAARLGWRVPVAVDLDAEALDSARSHASLNGASIALVRADGGAAFASGAFDLVLANLTAPLLLERCHEIGRLAAPRATIVLAGLLVEDVDSLVPRYASFGAVSTEVDGEWASLVVRRAP